MRGDRRRSRAVLVALALSALASCATSPAAYRTLNGAMRDRWIAFPTLSDDDVTFLEATMPPFPRSGDSDGARVDDERGGEYLVFVSTDSWELARDVGSALTGLRERVVGRVERILLHRTPERERVWLDVDSRRVGAALVLNAQGWDRIERGRWRSPSGREELLLARRDVWTFDRDIAPYRNPAAVRESVVEEFYPRLSGGGPPLGEETAALFSATGSSGVGNRQRIIAWITSPPIPGFPDHVGPNAALLTLNEEAASGYLAVQGAISFSGEREARVALVPARLLLPQFAVAQGMELTEDFDILRDRETIVIVGLRIDPSAETGVLNMILADVSAEGGAP